MISSKSIIFSPRKISAEWKLALNCPQRILLTNQTSKSLYRSINGANLDRRSASANFLKVEMERSEPILKEGARLRAAEIASRRASSEAQARNIALVSARATLSDFARSVRMPTLDEGETFEAGASRISTAILTQVKNIEQRLFVRRIATERILTIQATKLRREEIEKRIAIDLEKWQKTNALLERAQQLRDQGNAIGDAVDEVRSTIIRREFNDRLNIVWRDLFVRLAPSEPFVPAFRVPAAATQNLQPKLITEHRDGGDAGGTPGAMLSSGNLNTAALTPFTALHF